MAAGAPETHVQIPKSPHPLRNLAPPTSPPGRGKPRHSESIINLEYPCTSTVSLKNLKILIDTFKSLLNFKAMTALLCGLSTQINNVVEEMTDMLNAAPNYSIQRAKIIEYLGTIIS